MTALVRVLPAEWADPEVRLPSYQTDAAAGADLRANLHARHRASGLGIESGGWKLVPLGFSLELPAGFEGQIRPRSGLALKYGVTVLNAPGTIDSDYRGEVGVVLANLGPQQFTVRHGDRIAQLVIAPAVSALFALTESVNESGRGKAGFGSTGRH